MSSDRCEIVERKTPVFGFGMLATLRSPLSADAAWARLEQTLPRFEVPPEYSTIAGPRPRIYFGSIHDNAFQLNSAVYIGKPRPAHLSIRGMIESHGDESLIQLRVDSVAMTARKVIFAAVGVIVPVLLLIMFKDAGVNLLSAFAFFVMATPVAVVSIVAVVLVHARVQREFTFLLDYLQSTFE